MAVHISHISHDDIAKEVPVMYLSETDDLGGRDARGKSPTCGGKLDRSLPAVDGFVKQVHRRFPILFDIVESKGRGV
jgi:hypothetical protein